MSKTNKTKHLQDQCIVRYLVKNNTNAKNEKGNAENINVQNFVKHKLTAQMQVIETEQGTSDIRQEILTKSRQNEMEIELAHSPILFIKS